MTANLVQNPMSPESELRKTQPASSATWWDALFHPVDSAFLAGLRILYGITMFARAWYYVAPSKSGVWFDKTHEYYLGTDLHFSYYGFEWVQLLPGRWMHALFIGMMIVSACVTLGLFYRAASILLCIAYVYVFLLDKALFLNHYYLLSLFSFLMCLVPAQCVLSLDAWRKPQLRSDVVPAWTLWLLRGQLAIPYIFGGIAKLNADWLHGEPMRKWIYTGLMGHGREYLHNEYAVAFVTYGGVLFDLLVVPLLLWRRTRWLAFAAVIVFNLCNSQLFRIGVFPWFMLFGTTIFFPPAWHRRVLNAVVGLGTRGRSFAEVARDFQAPPAPRAASSLLFEKMCRPARRHAVVAFLAVYAAFQVLVPLRQFLYGGQPAWTGKGDLFSWRMMLYDKTGEVKFFLADPGETESTGTRERRTEIPVRVTRLLPKEISRQVGIGSVDDDETEARTPAPSAAGEFVAINGYQHIMVQRDPDLILQLGHYIARRFRAEGGADAEIYVSAKVSLNTRKPQLLVDPEVNLAQVERRAYGPTPWIMPFENGPRRRLDQAIHDLPPLPIAPARPSRDSEGPRYTTPFWE